jgi:hypothetical protein
MAAHSRHAQTNSELHELKYATITACYGSPRRLTAPPLHSRLLRTPCPRLGSGFHPAGLLGFSFLFSWIPVRAWVKLEQNHAILLRARRLGR